MVKNNDSDWRKPFSLREGWLFWAGVGLVGALVAIGLTGAALSFFSGDTPQREVNILQNFHDIISF